MRHLILMALLLVGCAPHPPSPPVGNFLQTPVPIPAPSAPVPSPARGPLFRLDAFGPNAPDGSFLSAILRASEEWNRALGFEAIAWYQGRPVTLAQYAGVAVEGVDPSKLTLGVTFREAGLIVFSGKTPERLRYKVAAHELGHLIGLPHNDDPTSLMFPSGNATGDITPQDARRAKEALWTPQP